MVSMGLTDCVSRTNTVFFTNVIGERKREREREGGERDGERGRESERERERERERGGGGEGDSQTGFGLFDFLTSSSTTRLYRGRVPRLTSNNFMCCHTRDRVGRP